MSELRIKSGNSFIMLETWGDHSFRHVLLYCHGFPGTNRLPGLKKRLPRGITLVEINYRGDKKSEGVFGFRYAIEDVIRAVRFVRKKYRPRTLVALGYSAGGLYALNAAWRYPQLFSSLLLLNPLVNSYFLDGAPVMKKLWAFTKKKRIIRVSSARVYREEVKRLHHAHNPLTFADKIKLPVTIVQSDKDKVLPAYEVKSFFDLLKTRKRYIALMDKGHECTGDELGIIRSVRA